MSEPKQRRLPDLDGGGIIRVEKRERFLTIENETVRDKRMTFGARGLLSYLLSHSDKWEVKVSNLIKQSPAGKHAIYSLLSELERFRYLIRSRRRGRAGRIYWVRTVYETPQGDPLTLQEVQQLHGGRPKKKKGDRPSPPLPGFPYLDGPDTARPDTARPDMENQDAKELPSEELPNKELPTGVITTTTKEGGGGGEQPLSKFALEQVAEWAAAEPGILMPDRFARRRWLDGAADMRIEAYFASRDQEEAPPLPPLKLSPERLEPEVVDHAVSMLADLLDEGRPIEELERQFSGAFVPEQWGDVKAAALEAHRRRRGGGGA